MKSNKKIVICVLVIIVSIISLILINKNTNKTFNYKGSTIALTVDGNSATSFPSKGKYNVSVNCENGKGVWNPKTWKLEITKIKGTVTCDVSFNSNASNLSDIVTNNAQNKNDTTIAPVTYGYRYQGADPDNYVWYNDELWRIIGYVPVSVNSATETGEYRVKIIRNNSIGAFVRETNTSSTTVWGDKSLYTL